jgi:hypothetical protein
MMPIYPPKLHDPALTAFAYVALRAFVRRRAQALLRHRAMSRFAGFTTVAVAAGLLAGCASAPSPENGPERRPEDVRAEIVHLLPPGTPDAAGWATDLYTAFSALQVAPTPPHLCGAIAIAQQESGLSVDPAVPGLGRIAWGEIERRASQHGIPSLLVHGALQLKSPDGRSYAERIDAARTEKDLSDTFDAFIGEVPLGKRLFASMNPVHTAGPMQVSIAFAEQFAKDKGYPYPVASTIRQEVFTRRGGLYFGVAHLLAYPVHYDRMLYRFADYNAGHWASRNAAFQQAVSRASGIPLAPDGDLVKPGSERSEVGATELAVRALGPKLGLSERDIRDGLEAGTRADFDDGVLWRRVFELAERLEGRPLPRAVLPDIRLDSPKITRKLTTAWFAEHVEGRYRACLGREPAVTR